MTSLDHAPVELEQASTEVQGSQLHLNAVLFRAAVQLSEKSLLPRTARELSRALAPAPRA